MSELNNFASSLPVVGGFFASDEQDEAKRRLLALLDSYKGPEADPHYEEEMGALRAQGHGQLTAQDRANMLEQLTQAGGFARGREGAIAQNQLMRGGGVANSGQSAVLQAQAGQDAAQRLQSAGMQTNAMASERGMRARQAWLDTLARNTASMNNYKMAATGNYVNFLGGVDDARKASMNQGVQLGAAALMGRPPVPMPGTPAAATAGRLEQGPTAGAPAYSMPYDNVGVPSYASAPRQQYGDYAPEMSRNRGRA